MMPQTITHSNRSCQLPQVISACRMLVIMKDARIAFAERLSEVCSDKGLRPHGRQAAMVRNLKARGIDVTQPAVKKWFDGEVIPDTDKCIEIAIWGDVCFEWLMTGRGPKRINELYPSRTIAHVAEVMRAMEPEQQYKAAQIVDLFAQPASSNEPIPPNQGDRRSNGGQ